MSEVLRSSADIPSYESSFTYPTSEDPLTVSSAVTSIADGSNETDKDSNLPQQGSAPAPHQVQPLPTSDMHITSQSPNSRFAVTQNPTQIHSERRALKPRKPHKFLPNVSDFARGDSTYTEALLLLGRYNMSFIVSIASQAMPQNVFEYAELIKQICFLLYEDQLDLTQKVDLEDKFEELSKNITLYASTTDPTSSQLYIVVEQCFDALLKCSMMASKTDFSTKAISFLTCLMINLNYWEVYNLLNRNLDILKFLKLINFDFHECYSKFVLNYAPFKYRHIQHSSATADRFYTLRANRKSERKRRISEMLAPGDEDHGDNDDHFVNERVSADGKVSSKEKRKLKVDEKLAAHRVIKKPDLKPASARSANYDPDVIHECQLPSAEEPGKLCLRRFSRKYELIRHQDTVHLKKKKLFKCFVCVRQDPVMGPRIFTRHDTLAKHIRVNHRISGKEAKAEVAYSKKHAEIVDEGDITVHVGRRKTKVDFELRAHMNKGGAREGPDGSLEFDDEEGLSGEEGEPMIDVV